MIPRDAYRAVATTTLAVLLGVGVAIVVAPFFPALLWATAFSVLTYPLYRRWGGASEDDRRRTVAALLAVLFTLVLVLIPFALIGVGIGVQFKGLAGEAAKTDWMARTEEVVRPLVARFGVRDFDLDGLLKANQDEIVRSLRAPAGRFAGEAGKTLLTLVVALLSQFFLLRDGWRLAGPAEDLSPLGRERTRALGARVADTVHAVFAGTVLVAVVQGAIIGIAYALVGVPNALLLGVVSAVLCVVPLLGAPIVYIPVGLGLIATGETTKGAIILGIGFLVVSQIDNLLKPVLIGGRTNLHPLAIFFAVLGGVAAVGPIGVVAGPMLLTVALGFVAAVREGLTREG